MVEITAAQQSSNNITTTTTSTSANKTSEQQFIEHFTSGLTKKCSFARERELHHLLPCHHSFTRNLCFSVIIWADVLSRNYCLQYYFAQFYECDKDFEYGATVRLAARNWYHSLIAVHTHTHTNTVVRVSVSHQPSIMPYFVRWYF